MLSDWVIFWRSASKQILKGIPHQHSQAIAMRKSKGTYHRCFLSWSVTLLINAFWCFSPWISSSVFLAVQQVTSFSLIYTGISSQSFVLLEFAIPALLQASWASAWVLGTHDTVCLWLHRAFSRVCCSLRALLCPNKKRLSGLLWMDW